MRFARGLAALVALATVGFAIGDFASHPNPLGALGLLALVAVFGFLLSYLYRPRNVGPKRTAPEPEERKPRRRAQAPVWSGWNAEEAQVAREQRRERRN